jgi:hypothetical protein
MKTHSDSRHPYLRIPDVIAINVIAVIAAIAAVVAMTESYTNLLDFAENSGLHGWRADIAPAAIDSFIVMGELLLFTAMIRGWDKRPAVYGWALAIGGFIISVAGNIGHQVSAPWQSRAMSALFPVAATVALAAGLMILKRVVRAYREQTQAVLPHWQLPALLGSLDTVTRPARPQPGAAEPPAGPVSTRPAATQQHRMHVVADEDAIAADVRAGMSRLKLAEKHKITPYRAEEYRKQFTPRKEA